MINMVLNYAILKNITSWYEDTVSYAKTTYNDMIWYGVGIDSLGLFFHMKAGTWQDIEVMENSEFFLDKTSAVNGV